MKRIKKLTSIALSTILCFQLIPTISFAASNTNVLNKAPGYQDFPAYYSDSHYTGNQVTHPDVVVMAEPWNGYRYWAVYTPNVSGLSAYENPCIVCSADGANWGEPMGLTNPIEPEPANNLMHNCDADMIYNPEMDAMMAYWNWADDRSGGVGAEVRLRISYDGIHWGVPVTYNRATKEWIAPTNEAERQVVSGPQDYITAIHSSARYDMLSPTFVYDSYRDAFFMWANNAGDVGYNNGQNNYVRMWSSEDGITWGEPIRVKNFLGVDSSGRQLAPWHQDIRYISELKEFFAMSQCFSGSNPDGSVLHLTKSRDGVNWQQVGALPLLSPGASGSWDDFQIYRSSFYYEPGTTVGDGTVRVWYSALQKDTANKMVPDSSGNLTIQAKDRDSRIWRIGYAENGYIDMMRSLLNDPTYTEPALVAGESLTLALSMGEAPIPVGEKATLITTFAPADTSDQVVKYTSSDPDVANVDALGTVFAANVGTTTITAQTEEGLAANIVIEVVPNSYRLVPQSTMTASATSAHPGTTEGPAANVLDGNLATIWHTKYNPQDPLPQCLTVSFGQTRSVNKYVYTPRQNGSNGTVTGYELYAVAADGAKTLIASGTWAMDSTDKAIIFAPVDANGLELKVLAGYGGFGTAAEINVYEDSGSEPPTPAEVKVDAMDASLVYTGAWNDDHNSAFYRGNARYTAEAGAAVELAFNGTAIRWYGQHDLNFGIAKVYLDGELAETVNVQGPAGIGLLLFERAGLAAGAHTIRIVCGTPVVDVDYFSYF